MGEEVASERAFEFDERWVLECVYNRLSTDKRWPTFQDVDFDADRAGVADPLSTLQALSSQFVQGVGPIGEPSPRQEVTLSLLGLAAVADWNHEARTDLDLYLQSVRAAVELADSVTSPTEAWFDGLKFFVDVFPSGPYEAVVIRMGLIWMAAGSHLYEQFSGGGTHEWRALLRWRSLRAYRRVTTISDLLTKERRRVRGSDAAAAEWDRKVARVESPAAAATADGLPQWVGLLPDGFREDVAASLAVRPADAISTGWRVLGDLIFQKTGLDLDGYDLVNQAFGGRTPHARLAPETKAGNNLHEGYADLMRGLTRMRNVQSHRGRPQVTDLHVAAVVLAMGDCYSVVLSLPDADMHA
ncbi:hypothetical protein GCM10023350_09320 [Nocardioides endophyticus]|uniref:Conserved hypothetical protein CHP02391 domain-containing protein n=1 Tax=Nocardioides endophyticus TaxID=1353775 RepID=A0ABP8YGK8_9ACTN